MNIIRLQDLGFYLPLLNIKQFVVKSQKWAKAAKIKMNGDHYLFMTHNPTVQLEESTTSRTFTKV